jgi:hypothetical protein
MDTVRAFSATGEWRGDVAQPFAPTDVLRGQLPSHVAVRKR